MELLPLFTVVHLPIAAHGCNSVLATTTTLHLADYTITEAGFGADPVAQKFLDNKTLQTYLLLQMQ